MNRTRIPTTRARPANVEEEVDDDSCSESTEPTTNGSMDDSNPNIRVTGPSVVLPLAGLGCGHEGAIPSPKPMQLDVFDGPHAYLARWDGLRNRASGVQAPELRSETGVPVDVSPRGGIAQLAGIADAVNRVREEWTPKAFAPRDWTQSIDSLNVMEELLLQQQLRLDCVECEDQSCKQERRALTRAVSQLHGLIDEGKKLRAEEVLDYPQPPPSARSTASAASGRSPMKANSSASTPRSSAASSVSQPSPRATVPKPTQSRRAMDLDQNEDVFASPVQHQPKVSPRPTPTPVVQHNAQPSTREVPPVIRTNRVGESADAFQAQHKNQTPILTTRPLQMAKPQEPQRRHSAAPHQAIRRVLPSETQEQQPPQRSRAMWGSAPNGQKASMSTPTPQQSADYHDSWATPVSQPTTQPASRQQQQASQQPKAAAVFKQRLQGSGQNQSQPQQSQQQQQPQQPQQHNVLHKGHPYAQNGGYIYAGGQPLRPRVINQPQSQPAVSQVPQMSHLFGQPQHVRMAGQPQRRASAVPTGMTPNGERTWWF